VSFSPPQLGELARALHACKFKPMSQARLEEAVQHNMDMSRSARSEESGPLGSFPSVALKPSQLDKSNSNSNGSSSISSSSGDSSSSSGRVRSEKAAQELAEAIASLQEGRQSSDGTISSSGSNSISGSAGSSSRIVSGSGHGEEQAFNAEAVHAALLLGGRLVNCADGEEAMSVLSPMACINVLPSPETLQV